MNHDVLILVPLAAVEAASEMSAPYLLDGLPPVAFAARFGPPGGAATHAGAHLAVGPETLAALAGLVAAVPSAWASTPRPTGGADNGQAALDEAAGTAGLVMVG